MATLTKTQLLEYLEDLLDEPVTDGTGKFNVARVCRAINRELERIGNANPVRTLKFEITGDDTTAEWELPEPMSDWHVQLDSTLAVPKLSYSKLLQEDRLTLLAGTLYSDYGWAIVTRDKQYLVIEPVLQTGETREFYYIALPGAVRETTYSTGTVTATNDSATITGSGTTWTTNATAGDAITIAGEYYVIKTVSGDTSIVLTEKYRGATGAGKSHEIGNSLGVSAFWNDAIAMGVAYRLMRQEGRTDADLYRDYRRAYSIASATQEQLMLSDLGTAYR